MRTKRVLKLSYVAWEKRIKSGSIPGRSGVLEFTNDGTRIICPLCGLEFKVISGTHLKKHGLDINARDFRKLMGLQRNQPLAADEFRELKRKQNLERGLSRHILPFIPTFKFRKGEDSRRSKPARQQERNRLRDIVLNRRKREKPSRGTKSKSPTKRKITPAGRINLFGTSYFFSKKKKHRGLFVEIKFEGDEFVATLDTWEGTPIVRRYKRKT